MEKISVPKFKLSTESIAPQVGDYVVTEMNKIHEEILEIGRDQYRKGKDRMFNLSKIPAVKDLMDRFDILISKRFGMEFNTTHTNMTLAACIPVPPKKSNILNRWASDLSSAESEGLTAAEEKKIIDSVKSSQAILDEHLKTKAVIFDLNKAIIRGLPADYKVNLICNYMGMVEIELTAQEATSVMLHEIGHCWTHLEYSYRNTRNTTVLLDTFMDNYRNKNKTAKESLVLGYIAATNDSSARELLDKNTPAVFAVLTKNYLSFCSEYVTGGTHQYTDSEQLADSFASKFGLGGDIVSALTKAQIDNMDIIYASTIISGISGAITVFATIGLLCMGGVGILLALYTGIFSFFFIGLFYNLLFRGERITEEMTYDVGLRRFQRIKNETIKVLRTTELSKDDMKTLLDSIDIIDENMKIFAKYVKEKDGPVERIVRMFNSNKVEIKRLEQMTEDLMENKLHVAANKLKLIG